MGTLGSPTGSLAFLKLVAIRIPNNWNLPGRNAGRSKPGARTPSGDGDIIVPARGRV
jgi:hypothetical protein